MTLKYLYAAAAAFLFFTACSEKKTAQGKPDGSIQKADADGGTPQGDDNQAPPSDNGGEITCGRDSDCPAGKICELGTGRCVPGQFCQATYNCPNVEYCKEGSGCYCEAAGQPAAVCRRYQSTCSPCSADQECGEGGKCVTFPQGGAYCLPDCNTAMCPEGYYCNSARQDFAQYICLPGSPADETVQCGEIRTCSSDADCEQGYYCRTLAGVCVPRCTYDRQTGRSTGCATAQICHGNGQCGAFCTQNSECVPYGADFICENGRCKINGCLDSADCEADHYCKTDTHECLDGCQLDADCASGKRCEENRCNLIPCNERQGGRNTACDLHQFCCGENADIPCTDGASDYAVGQCFYAPNEYCTTCTPDDKMKDAATCGESKFGQENFCIELQDEDGNKLGNICTIGCRIDANPTDRYFDCPRGHECVKIQVTENGSTREITNCIRMDCLTWVRPE